MDRLTQLVKLYKKNKSSKNLVNIFEELDTIITKKSKYIFYKQPFYIKGKCFRLCETKTISLDDIKQELIVLILELIKQYNGKKSFKTYLFSSIWHWGSNLLNSSLANQIITKNSSEMIDEERNINYFNNLSANKITIREDYNFDKIKLSKMERKVIKLYKKNPDFTQTQLARRLGVTQARVSQILQKLRKKLKKYL